MADKDNEAVAEDNPAAVEAAAADPESAKESAAADTEVAAASTDAPKLAEKFSTADPEPAEESATTDPEPTDESASADSRRETESTAPNGLRLSISVRTLLVTAVIAALVVAVGVLTWLHIGDQSELGQQERRAADNHHAEQIALDYAVGAAKIDYKNLDAWKQDLVKGTTHELTEKLNDAAKSMEQILAPLQWNSTATPLVAKVRSNNDGIYVVDTFVGVETKTIQAPDGLQSTATYSVTIDGNHNWQISEVGGIGSVIEHK